jgi:type II secretory pathway component PulF
VTWQTFPPEIPERASLPYLCELNKDCSWLDRVKNQLDMDQEQRAALQSAILLALVPPALVLAFGSALIWAFRGFR